MGNRLAAFAFGVVITACLFLLLGSGTVRTTQGGVPWATVLYCQELIDAIDDKSGTKAPPTDIDTDMAVSEITSLEWDLSGIIENDCDVLVDCTAECLAQVCSGDTRTETVAASRVLIDSGGKPYCECVCSDGLIAIITDCA